MHVSMPEQLRCRLLPSAPFPLKNLPTPVLLERRHYGGGRGVTGAEMDTADDQERAKEGRQN